MTPQLPLPN
nr:unnamed protein product [Callosobruchus analis]